MKILVAGASGGIGGFLAERLSKEHDVYGTYHSKQPKGDLKYHMSKVDITKDDEAFIWISMNCDPTDDVALVYCIGTNYNCMMHKSEAHQWLDVIDSNLIGAQHVLRHVLPIMRQRKFGRIILLSSVVPQIGVPGTSAYAASKAALWGVSKAVAMENAAYGITINTINLGYFDIGMIRAVPHNVMEEIVAKIPSKMLGKPENILLAVQFLIRADYITGSQINLNGGLY